jgi:hypothetical protein
MSSKVPVFRFADINGEIGYFNFLNDSLHLFNAVGMGINPSEGYMQPKVWVNVCPN